ncbi:MAG: hypothetical protein J3Q66DRAFT_331646 [Benniella sp.]|nr:MAG: hypothetical protein J3Q66DRAFT_331646 [Benniella sp.]
MTLLIHCTFHQVLVVAGLGLSGWGASLQHTIRDHTAPFLSPVARTLPITVTQCCIGPVHQTGKREKTRGP